MIYAASSEGDRGMTKNLTDQPDMQRNGPIFDSRWLLIIGMSLMAVGTLMKIIGGAYS